jgi:hypothetical protein
MRIFAGGVLFSVLSFLITTAVFNLAASPEITREETAFVSPLGVIGRLNLPGEVTAVAVYNEQLYAAGPDGFFVVDIADPAKPLLQGSLNHSFGAARAVALSGHYALVSAGENGLIIVDIADPTEPVYVNQQPLSSSAGPLIVRDHLAYILVGEVGFAIWEIADPAIPIYMGGDVDLVVEQFDLVGDYLYLVGNPVRDSAIAPFPGGALYIYDVSDPTQPEQVAADEVEVGDPYAPRYRSVAIHNHIAYISVALRIGSAIWQYDVTDPTDPIGLAYTFYPLANQMLFVGDWLYTVNPYDATVGQLADTGAPHLIAWYKGGGLLAGLAAQNGLVLTAAQSELLVLRPLSNQVFLPAVVRG